MIAREIGESSRGKADAVETASPLLEERAHHLESAVPRTGLRIEADVHRLAQAVQPLQFSVMK